MKRTSKRLLALLLVLTMAIGVMPFAALSVGAEQTIANEIIVGEDGTIQELGWQPGYVLAETAPDGEEPWTAVNDGSWEQAYYYTAIKIIPKAGTTLVWSEPAVLDGNGDPMLMGEDYCFLTSWVETAENIWEQNLVGVNLKSGYTNNGTAYPAANYSYDAVAQTVTYTYTTTQDNEALRFGCYGGQADGTLASNPDECPAIYVYAPAFEEGAVENVLWMNGYVGSYLEEQGFANKIRNGAEGYVYSAPITVPNAGTTISFSGMTSDEAVYVFSAWRVADDGRLEMIYGCPGGDNNSAWLTVDEESGAQTYAYTTSYDNEIVRLSYCVSDDATPVIHYVENNADNLAPVLKAAGYDPTIDGTIYMIPWYVGAINPADGTPARGLDSYRYSDVLAVYGKGTKVTFVDVTDANAGADGFVDNEALAFGKFDGTNYDGRVNAGMITTPVAGGVAGATKADREAAVKDGKMVFTYTTTEDKEYLRMTVASSGNMINGSVVPPIVYVGDTDTARSYNILNGKKIVAIGDDYLRGGATGDENTWLSLLASRYDMLYYNYSMNGSTMAAITGAPSIAESYSDMVDGADVVILSGGKNDLLSNIPVGVLNTNDPTVYYGAVKTVVDGLMAKYPDAVIVCVTPWEEDAYNTALATYAESLNDTRVCAIRANKDMPVFMGDDTYKSLYAQEFNGLNLLNPAGNRLVMPLFEAMIGSAYRNHLGLSTEGKGVQFVIGDELLDAHGTVTGACTMVAPKATDAVCADNMFGWYGVVTNGDTTKGMLIKVGQKVDFAQGDVAVFEPLTLDMRQVSDPSLRMKNDEIAGLRFLTGVSKAGYQSLLGMIAGGALANAELTFGTLIATPNGEKDVPFNMALNAKGEPVWYEQNEELGYFAGSVWDSDLTVNSAGIAASGYAKLTVDGVDYYAYAKNNNKKTTSIYELAIEALNKVSTVQDADHKLQIGKDLFSPYSVSERKVLRKFVDNVVSLQTSAAGDVVELIDYKYYNPNSKWQVTVVTEDDGIWDTLMAQLGDPDVAAISMLEATDESASAAGGILLDGVVFEGEAIEYAGNTYYLIAFDAYSPNY
ncbi:MAG: SGNH/GDSL hydrolase family protein [Clostridia bacterium]|nr:SGNH/GDSL hydrolase family protein [Clostridia bacterium]